MERRALVGLMKYRGSAGISKSRILALARQHRGNVAAMTAELKVSRGTMGISRATVDRRIVALGLRDLLAQRYPRGVRGESGRKKGRVIK